MLQSTGSQRVGYNLAAEQQQFQPVGRGLLILLRIISYLKSTGCKYQSHLQNCFIAAARLTFDQTRRHSQAQLTHKIYHNPSKVDFGDCSVYT